MSKLKKGMAALLCTLLVMAMLPMGAMAAVVGIEGDTPTLTLNSTIVAFAGQEWYVIGDGTNGAAVKSGHLTLLAKDNVYGDSAFRTGQPSDPNDGSMSYHAASNYWYANNPSGGPWVNPNEYRGSTLQQKMVTIADTINTSSAGEYALITARTLTAGDDTDYPITGGDVPDQKLWPLSYNEYGAILAASIRGFADYFWQRSPSNYNFAYVGEPDGVIETIGFVNISSNAVRPALHLNLSSVIFTSDASGASAKSSATAGGGLVGATAPGAKLKFTMLDSNTSNLNLAITDNSARAARPGGSVTIAYTGAITAANKFVSCVVTDSSNTIKYYGKLATASSGDAVVNIPADMPQGNYTIKLFNEEANADNFTDFCSAPVEVPLTVDATAPTVESTSPVGGAVDVAITANTLSVTFSEAMDTTTPGTVSLAASQGHAPTLTAVSGAGYWTDGGKTVNYTLSGLEANATYTYNISGFKDLAGNPMDAVSSGIAFSTVKGTQHNAPTVPSGPIKEKGKDATFKFDGNLQDVRALLVNGTRLTMNPALPTGATTQIDISAGSVANAGQMVPGSVVLTLKAAYLDTLPNGTYTVEVQFADGYGTAQVVINRPTGGGTTPTSPTTPQTITPTGGSPQTGDTSNVPLWAGLGLSALLALAFCGAWVRKTMHRKKQTEN